MNDEGYNYRWYISQWSVSTSSLFGWNQPWDFPSHPAMICPSVARSAEVLLKVWPSSSLQRSMNRCELVFQRWKWVPSEIAAWTPIEVDSLLSLLSIRVLETYQVVGNGICEPSTVASFWCQFYVKLVLVKWVNYSFRSFGIAHDVGVDLDD